METLRLAHLFVWCVAYHIKVTTNYISRNNK